MTGLSAQLGTSKRILLCHWPLAATEASVKVEDERRDALTMNRLIQSQILILEEMGWLRRRMVREIRYARRDVRIFFWRFFYSIIDSYI